MTGLEVAAALAITGAFIGGSKARKAAKRQRSAIEDAVQIAGRNLAHLTTQIRVNEGIQQQEIARNLQRNTGTVLAAISPSSLSAVETARSQLSEAALDSFSVKEDAKRKRQGANFAYVEQVTGLRNQLPSVGAATLQGAISGAQAGLQLGSAVSEFRTLAPQEALNRATEAGQARTVVAQGRALDAADQYLVDFGQSVQQSVLERSQYYRSIITQGGNTFADLARQGWAY